MLVESDRTSFTTSCRKMGRHFGLGLDGEQSEGQGLWHSACRTTRLPATTGLPPPPPWPPPPPPPLLLSHTARHHCQEQYQQPPHPTAHLHLPLSLYYSSQPTCQPLSNHMARPTFIYRPVYRQGNCSEERDKRKIRHAHDSTSDEGRFLWFWRAVAVRFDIGEWQRRTSSLAAGAVIAARVIAVVDGGGSGGGGEIREVLQAPMNAASELASGGSLCCRLVWWWLWVLLLSLLL